MQIERVSAGKQVFDPCFPLVCERIHDTANLFVPIPYVVRATAYVYDVQRILQQSHAPAATQLTEDSFNTIIGIITRVMDGMTTLQRQTDNDDPQRANAAVQDIVNAYMDALGVPNDDRDQGNVATQLLRTVMKYRMQETYQAELFRTVIDQISDNPVFEGDPSVFSLASVAPIVSLVNNFYAQTTLGQHEAAALASVLSVFGSSLQSVGIPTDSAADLERVLVPQSDLVNFTSRLMRYMTHPGGPMIQASFYEVEERLRNMMGMDELFHFEGFSPSADEEDCRLDLHDTTHRFIHPLSEFRYSGGWSNRMLSFIDLYLACIAVKAGEGADGIIDLGNRLTRTQTLNDLMRLRSNDMNTYRDFTMTYPSDVHLTRPDSSFEGEFFQEVFFYKLIKRVLMQTPSDTGQRLLGLVAARKMDRQSVYAAAFQNTLPVLGTIYDTFVETASYIRGLLSASNICWEGTVREETYLKWANEHLDLLGKYSERSDSPRYMYGVSEMINRKDSLEVYTPQSYLEDALIRDGQHLVFGTNGKDVISMSMFRYFENRVLSGSAIDAPMAREIPYAFRIAPMTVSARGYYIIPVVRPMVNPLSQSEINSLTILPVGAIDESGFPRLYQESTSIIIAHDIEQLSRETNIPMEWIRALGFAESFHDLTPQIFFRWPDVSLHYLVFSADDIPVYEVAETFDYIGNPTRFKAIWPYLQFVETSPQTSVLPSNAYLQTGQTTVVHPDRLQEVDGRQEKVDQAHALAGIEPKPLDNDETASAPEATSNEEV